MVGVGGSNPLGCTNSIPYKSILSEHYYSLSQMRGGKIVVKPHLTRLQFS